MITKSKAKLPKVKLLLVGCGDIAQRLVAQLDPEAYQCIGLRRNVASLPPSIEPLACDLNDNKAIEQGLKSGFDYVVITLTPNQRDEAGYRQTFETNLSAVLNALQAATKPPKHLLFVSSTSVYHQDKGEWVDEKSETKPDSFRGQTILKAENLCLNSEINSTIVRFSGIYGPGRGRLIEQVREGRWSSNDEQWTNRIHSEDAAAVLAWCLQRINNNLPLEKIILASDCEPSPKNQVCAWMAKHLGVLESTSDENKTLNKRCSNQTLLEAGFLFSYPTFREGYRRLLAEQALLSISLLEKLKDYDAKVVSTIWAGLDIDGSDIDIIACFTDRAVFIEEIRTLFETLPEFSISDNETRVLVQFKVDGFLFEIFACDTPVEQQAGYRHFSVMKRLVKIGGPVFQSTIRQLKRQGLKTEPAIARLMKLEGDPYQAVLTLYDRDDEGLSKLFLNNES